MTNMSYPNLPGIEVSLRDGGLILPDDATTETLLIIGPTTQTGTPENPVLIRTKEDLVANKISKNDAEAYVEPVVGVNKLAAAWKAAYEGGARQIYLLAVPVTGTDDAAYKSYFLGVQKSLFGILEDFPVDNLVVIDGFADKLTTALELATDFPEAESMDKVNGIVAKIEGELTTYFGDFAKAVSDYCEMQTLNHNSVVGYIGTTAPADFGLAKVKEHVGKLVAEKKQYSGFLSVVAGPELGYQVPGSVELHYTSGVVTYAALVTNLRPESATTNKPVYGVSAIGYNMSLRQLNDLSGAQYVSFRFKNGQVHVTDGITTAKDVKIGNVTQKSDYIRLSTLRITQAAVALVREIADPYVGEPNGAPQRNALNAAVRGGLEGMKNAGAIADYRFSITATPRQRILGQSVVNLEIVPAFEMRKISVNVSLRATLESTEQA